MVWRKARRSPLDEPGRQAVRRDRHGRAGRSSVVRPPLPALRSRIDLFDQTVATTADFLRGSWPEELAGVRFEVQAMPPSLDSNDGVDRWQTDAVARRITIFRIPIQRLSHLHRNDELHQRMMIESCVFRATAEFLGKDPWDLGPERFRFL
jgi:hypothetical protein